MANIEHYGILSVFIPLIVIMLAIITKDVVVSLLSGNFLGELVIHEYNFVAALVALLDRLVSLFAEAWITKTVIFVLLIGAIIKLINQSGGVEGFVNYLSKKYQNINSPTGALLLAYVIGIIIFIESSITVLVAGIIARPLCDKNGVSREKLAYVCDSTSAPICSLIPLNAWGALLLGLIVTAVNTQVIAGDGLSLLLSGLAFNFYALTTIAVVLLVILFNINIGPMRHTQALDSFTDDDSAPHKNNKSPWLMILPLVVMILMVPLSLFYTGKGDILQGSGSTSVFYAIITTLLFIYIYYIVTKHLKHKEYFKSLYSGIGNMIPIALILLLAFLISSVIKDLGTAIYLSDMIKGVVSPMFLPLLVFLVSALTSFSTGTSWGTFSIMMPIALALGATLGVDIGLIIGAVISGGIFGDHVSPISDTTIMSSMACGCDHISHVRTQMPYALFAAGLSALMYLAAGWITV